MYFSKEAKQKQRFLAQIKHMDNLFIRVYILESSDLWYGS